MVVKLIGCTVRPVEIGRRTISTCVCDLDWHRTGRQPRPGEAAREAQRGAVRVAENRRLQRRGSASQRRSTALVAAVQRRAQSKRVHLARAARPAPHVGMRRCHCGAGKSSARQARKQGRRRSGRAASKEARSVGLLLAARMRCSAHSCRHYLQSSTRARPSRGQASAARSAANQQLHQPCTASARLRAGPRWRRTRTARRRRAPSRRGRSHQQLRCKEASAAAAARRALSPTAASPVPARGRRGEQGKPFSLWRGVVDERRSATSASARGERRLSRPSARSLPAAARRGAPASALCRLARARPLDTRQGAPVRRARNQGSRRTRAQRALEGYAVLFLFARWSAMRGAS